MAGQITLGIICVALTFGLDWVEFKVLTWHSLGMRIGVLLMLTAGQLLLASTVIGEAVRKALEWSANLLGQSVLWAINLILSGLGGGVVPRSAATGIGQAVVIILCTVVVVRVIIGFIPSKLSTKGLDWNWVYAAALIPVLIFGLPTFAKGSAQELTNSITSWVTGQIDSKV